MKLIFRVLLGLVSLLLVTVAVALLAVRGSLPALDGERSAAGLGDETVIERDALGAVTVTGHSRADVAFATGFVHAQDRFFQMDLSRRMSGGRLSELVGDAAMDMDARQRMHRFHDVAERVYAQLAPAEKVGARRVRTRRQCGARLAAGAAVRVPPAAPAPRALAAAGLPARRLRHVPAAERCRWVDRQAAWPARRRIAAGRVSLRVFGGSRLGGADRWCRHVGGTGAGT